MQKNTLLSFIMPAKNASQFISEAIVGVKKQTKDNWELIIIEDHSDDNTYEIAKKEADKDDRIEVYKNIGKGKVIGLNFGYSLSRGNLIKCIDADDMISKQFVEHCLSLDFDVFCHSAYIVDFQMKSLGNNVMNKSFLDSDFDNCLENLLSLPRWTWTFNKGIAEKIFPMPESLPYEDKWFSLIIKRYAKEIINFRKPLYYYRQHNNQTYGGVFNFKSEIVIFRAKRNLRFVKSLIENSDRLSYKKKDIEKMLSSIIGYLKLMSKEKVSLKEIITSNQSLQAKSKIILIKKIPLLASFIKRLKVFKNGVFKRLEESMQSNI